MNKNVTTSIAKNLTTEHRAAIIKLFAQGYTIRHIRNYIMKEIELEPSEADLIKVAVLYSDDITLVRQELAEEALMTGLARKEERVRRMNELAEKLEELGDALKAPKVARTYLAVLKQIQGEMEPLGITVTLPGNDPWMQLLQKLTPPSTTAQLPDK